MNTFKIAIGAAIASMCVVGAAEAATLIDNSTQGNYNDGIGEVLNGTNPIVDDNGINTFLFPNINSDPNDPLIASAPEPVLGAASAELGNWLSTPGAPGGTWGGVQNIPSNWTVDSETAIIYELNGGATGLSNVVASFGVDNGIFVWLNGNYLGGAMAPGGAVLGELSINIGNVSAGTNYLQILREDHGGGTGYSVEVTGDAASVVPLPAAGWLLIAGLGGLGALRRRT